MLSRSLMCIFTMASVPLVCLWSTSVTAVPLGDLLAGGSITQGDKLFHDFQGDFAAFSAVEGITVGSEQGLRFSGTLNVLSGIVTGDLSYRVTVMDPVLRLHAMTATLGSNVTGTGEFENLFVIGGSPHIDILAEGIVSLIAPTTHPTFAFDEPSVIVGNGFNIIGPVQGGVTLDHTFAQTIAVPEPHTLLLLALALSCLGLYARCRRGQLASTSP
jgi:hypothetical protein